MTNQLLTGTAPSSKIHSDEPRAWVDLKHPETGRFIGKYCPQTHRMMVIERGKRGFIDLPKA